MKKCNMCLIMKNLQEFHKDKRTKDGHVPYCKKCKSIYDRIYRKEHEIEKRQKGREWHYKNKDVINKKKRDKYDPEKKHKYYIKNKDNIKARTKKYKRNRYHKDIEFKMKEFLSDSLRRLLKGKTKNSRALQYLGCSVRELKIHIESQFKPGMTWDNWSRNGWHIDHIIPLAKFNMLNDEEIKIACHYTNLQPLWAKENKRKGSKILPITS